jgi:hypothetical protein
MHKIDELKENINDLRLMFQRYQSNVDMTINNIMGALQNGSPLSASTSTRLPNATTTLSTTLSAPTTDDIQILAKGSDNDNVDLPTDEGIDSTTATKHDAFEIHDFDENFDDIELEDIDMDDINNLSANNGGTVAAELSELSDIEVDMDIDVDINNNETTHHLKKLELSDEDFSKIEKIAQSVNNNSVDVDNISNLDVGSIMMDDGEELVFDDIELATEEDIQALADEVDIDANVELDLEQVDLDNVNIVAAEAEPEPEPEADADQVDTDEQQNLPTDIIMEDVNVKTTDKKKKPRGRAAKKN